MTSNSHLQWVRPDNVPFPSVWMTFETKESKNSNKLVKHVVQDLPEDRFEDAVRHMTEYYLVDHPIYQTGLADSDYIEDMQQSWRVMLKQKCTLVCFQEGSDEIVGLNLHIVSTKNDTFNEYMCKLSKSKRYADAKKISVAFYGSFCPYDKYNVQQYLDCGGLSVHPKHRGCGIAQRILEARKPLAMAFDLKLTHCRFSSEESARIADRIGFKLDVEHTIEELTEMDPSIAYICENVKIRKISIKTWIF